MPRFSANGFGMSSSPANTVDQAEWAFLAETAVAAGVADHLTPDVRQAVLTRAMTDEGIASLELDGETACAREVVECIRLRLDDPLPESSPAAGIANILMDVLRHGDEPLSISHLEKWARFLAFGRPATHLVGTKRDDLRRYLNWLERDIGGCAVLSPLKSAAIAHFRFERIHPFPSCTGILGRAIVLRSLLRTMPQHFFVPLSTVFLGQRHNYHRHLDDACRDHNIGYWTDWFAGAAVRAAQEMSSRVRLARTKHDMLQPTGA